MIDPNRRHNRSLKPLKRRKTLSQEIKLTYRSLSFIVMILALGSSFSYLYVQSMHSSDGYSVKNLQFEYDSMQSDIDQLEQEIMEAKSLQVITEHPVYLSMVPSDPSAVHYVTEEDLAQH